MYNFQNGMYLLITIKIYVKFSKDFFEDLGT